MVWFFPSGLVIILQIAIIPVRFFFLRQNPGNLEHSRTPVLLDCSCQSEVVGGGQGGEVSAHLCGAHSARAWRRQLRSRLTATRAGRARLDPWCSKGVEAGFAVPGRRRV
jgi:hypothetical protein